MTNNELTALLAVLTPEQKSQLRAELDGKQPPQRMPDLDDIKAGMSAEDKKVLCHHLLSVLQG